MKNAFRSSSMMPMAGILALLLALGAPTWANPPETVNVHGSLVASDGTPLSGSRAYVVRFFDAESGGTQLGGDVTGMVLVSDEGLFNLPVIVPPAALAASALWYELGIDTDTPPDGNAEDDIFPERIRVHSVPYALEAGGVLYVDAGSIGDGMVTNTEFNYLAGVNQPIQEALDGKANAEDFSNVDNTSDMDKPVSTAMQAALDEKAPRVAEAFIMVETTSNPQTNGGNLRAAYEAAKAMEPHGQPLSATNRAVVLVPPGRYNLGRFTGIGPTGLTLDADFVDLVGLSTAREDQYIYNMSHVFPGGWVPDTTLVQTASDVRIENLVFDYDGDATDKFAYYPDANWGAGRTGSPPETRIRNCEFRAQHNRNSMRTAAEYAGTYENCVGGGWNAFGGGGGVASGTFIHCTGGARAFGGEGGEASGTFVHCTGGNEAFGAFGAASGSFTDCTGGSYAFGGGAGGVASGVFVHCTGGAYALGGHAIGIFRNCIGGNVSFGGGTDGNTTGGRFYNCHMAGPGYGANFNGRMENCRWGTGFLCDAEARIYRSTILGTVNLRHVSAGIAHSAVKGDIANTTAAVFNDFNLTSADVD